MTDFLINIGYNLSILLSLVLVFVYLRQEIPKAKRMGPVFWGVLFGIVAIFSMLTAFVYRPGILFDSRSIVIFLASLFGGPVTGILAMAIAGTYRLLVGGIGMFAGVATILVTGVFGVCCHYLIRRHNWPPSPLQLWGLGLVAHIMVFVCTLLLLKSLCMTLIVDLAILLLVVYPLVVLLLGSILVRGEDLSSNLSRLKHAEWLFEQAQILTRYGSWEYQIESGKLIATQHFHHLLGLPQNHETLLFQDIIERFHNEDRETIRYVFDTAIDEAKEFDIEGRFKTGAGHDIWLRLVGKPIVRKGTAVHLVGNLIDITRRKTIELDLKASEERLQAILEHTRSLICICDLEGKVILANRRFEVLDMRTEDLVGQVLYESLPLKEVYSLEQWLDDLSLLFADQQVEIEEELLHADGTVHTYLVSKFLLVASNECPYSVCYIAADISDLCRTLEERQVLANELKLKNDELERFTYSISHDLKAPLLTISSFSGLLGENLTSGNNDHKVEMLKHVRDAAEKMRHMIDGLLELSKVGRTVGEMVPVNLVKLIEETLQLLEGDRRKSGAQILIAPDIPTVPGDELRLGQVMQNLLQNAFKFADQDRSLQIDINWTKEPSGGLVVSFGDNGRGIKPSELQRIFTLFAHGDSCEGGFGIGLALVHRIMEKHGGSVWAESAGDGTGTTFFLRFPHISVVEGSETVLDQKVAASTKLTEC